MHISSPLGTAGVTAAADTSRRRVEVFVGASLAHWMCIRGIDVHDQLAPERHWLVNASVMMPPCLLPAWLAGDVAYERVSIDLAGLARRKGVQLICSEWAAVDLGRRRLAWSPQTAPLTFDSICIDPEPESDMSKLVQLSDALVCLHPQSLFIQRWRALESTTPPETVVVAGADHEAVNVALGLARGARRTGIQRSIALVTMAKELLPSCSAEERRMARRELARHLIQTHESDAVGVPGGLLLPNGRRLQADRVLVATPPRPSSGWVLVSGKTSETNGHSFGTSDQQTNVPGAETLQAPIPRYGSATSD